MQKRKDQPWWVAFVVILGCMLVPVIILFVIFALMAANPTGVSP